MFCSSEVVIGHSVAWPTRHQCWSLTPEPKRNDATSRSPMSGEQHFTLVWPTAGGRVGFESFDLNQPIVVNLARGTVGTSGVVLQAHHSAKDYVPRTLGGERAPVCFLGGGGEVEVVGPCHVEDSSTRISAPARWWSGGQSPDGGDILSAHQVVRDSRFGLRQNTCLQPFSPVHTMSAWTPLVWCPRCSTASVQDSPLNKFAAPVYNQVRQGQ